MKVRLIALLAALAVALAVTATASAGTSRAVQLGGLALGHHVVYQAGSITTGFSPTSADSLDQCTAGNFCLWDFQNFGGTFVFKSTNGWHDLTTFDNRAESARDNTSRDGKVATGYGGAGSQQCHAAGGWFVSLGSVFNNTVSSYALFASPVC